MLMAILRRLFLVLTLAVLTGPAWSLAVDPPLEDPVLEARAHAIFKQLRCLVCQNQSIEDSNADLARDLRILVRQRIAAGESDEQAIGYIVTRYGDWVLLRPPLKVKTILLWSSPIIFLILAVFGAIVWYRRWSKSAGAHAAPLSTDEQARLDALLGKEG